MSKKVWNNGCSGISFDAFYIPLALLLQNTLHQATLAMIIILAVLSLIRIEPIPEAWRVSRRDGVFAVLTFLITLALAPQLHWGILVGVGLSLAGYMQRTMRPHFAYLSRHPNGASSTRMPTI